MKATKEMLEMVITKRTKELSALALEYPTRLGKKFDYQTIKDITTLLTEKIIDLNTLLREYKVESKE